MKSVVIVGASLGGLRTAEALRAGGYEGDISLINGERNLPYDRPPLSKKFLSDGWDFERIRLRKDEELDELKLHFINGVTATKLDTSFNTVSLSNGEKLNYDALVIATGCRVRELPNQPTSSNVVMLRTFDDAIQLREQLDPNKRLVVIGAGFIGLEIASTAKALGCDVVVLEGLPAPLIRGLGEEMGNVFAELHRANGIDVRCGVTVDGFESVAGKVTAVIANGESINADVVVVGIGVIPNTEWLVESGLTIDNGVVCDEFLNAGPANVFAVGDVVRWPNAEVGEVGKPEVMRIEHWTNAVEQAAAVANNLLAFASGSELTKFASVPFFWSDQLEKRIQFMGRSHPEDEVEMITGSLEEGKFLAAYGHDNRLCGVLGLSMPRQVMMSRQILMERPSFSQGIERLREIVK